MEINRAAVKILAALGTMVYILAGLTGCGRDAAFNAPHDIMQAVIKENKEAKAESETTNHVQTETELEAAESEYINTIEPEHANTVLTGTITMAGSTSMEKFANALAESFMVKYPHVMVTVEFTGSSSGIESVLRGNVDIGNSSRTLKDEEKSSGAVENIVAIEGIAVITDKSNTVTDLSMDQLTGIYRGTIRNWSKVGGGDMPIVVVGREAGSGTRDTFEELLGMKDMCVYANELNSSGAVMAKAASIPGAIGYVSLDVLDNTVQILSISGVKPTEENIKAGSYLLCRPLVMVTNGEISSQSEAVKELFAYLKSEEGQELIRAVGLIIPD